MTRKLMLTVDVVDNGGLLVCDSVDIGKRYVFTDPHGFYSWLCQQMGKNAKPDSHTYDGRVVTSGHKLERLERIEEVAQDWSDNPYSTARIERLVEVLKP